jgi:hypothetical protein
MHSQLNDRTASPGSHPTECVPVLQAICEAIRPLCREERDYVAACRLLADDAGNVPPTGDRAGARLERAVARTTMELWARGMASPEDVASAYAALVLKLHMWRRGSTWPTYSVGQRHLR